MRLLLAANNQATRRRKHKKLPSISFNWVQAATDMHPACPNKKQNHLQNSLLRRTQFWVRKSFSKPASLKRASLVALPVAISHKASLKPKRCASATWIQKTSKNEPKHGPKNGTAWRSHFWDRMHGLVKEQKKSTFTVPFLGPSGGTKNETAKSQNQQQRPTNKKWQLRLVKQQAYRVGTVALPVAISHKASLKPKRCASATWIQKTSKNEPKHGPKNGTAWRSHFWDRMHSLVKEQKKSTFTVPFLGPSGGTKNETAKSQNQQQRPTNKKWQLRLVKQQAYRVGTVALPVAISHKASLKPKRCASATWIQKTSKNEPKHGPKNGTAWRSHFWDRMHGLVKEQKKSTFTVPFLGPSGGTKNETAKSQNQQQRPTNKKWQLRLVKQQAYRVGTEEARTCEAWFQSTFRPQKWNLKAHMWYQLSMFPSFNAAIAMQHHPGNIHQSVATPRLLRYSVVCFNSITQCNWHDIETMAE